MTQSFKNLPAFNAQGLPLRKLRPVRENWAGAPELHVSDFYERPSADLEMVQVRKAGPPRKIFTIPAPPAGW